MKTTFRHGDDVIASNIYSLKTQGRLYLPDFNVPATVRETAGEYGVYVLELPDGSRFRTEGRLSKP